MTVKQRPAQSTNNELLKCTQRKQCSSRRSRPVMARYNTHLHIRNLNAKHAPLKISSYSMSRLVRTDLPCKHTHTHPLLKCTHSSSVASLLISLYKRKTGSVCTPPAYSIFNNHSMLSRFLETHRNQCAWNVMPDVITNSS